MGLMDWHLGRAGQRHGNTVSLGRLCLLGMLSIGLGGCATQPATPERLSDEPIAAHSSASAVEQDAHAAAEAEREAAYQQALASGPPPPPADVWVRIVSGLQFDQCARPEVLQWANWYAEHDEYMQRVQERAAALLFFIANEVEANQLPGEMALLPIVESAFYPFAYSHGRASGLWQFVAATASRYDLRQSWWYDGRRDIYLATQAAMAHMVYLGNMFDGDWLLAFAAYNSGEGRVSRLVARRERAGLATDFWSLAEELPRETRGYVPKLLGLSCLYAHPSRFAFVPMRIADQPAVARVETEGQIDLALAADLAGMQTAELYQLNPAFNRWATDPDGPHHLLLPVERVVAFTQGLAGTPADQRVRWTRERIQSGDTLSHFARRHKVTVDMLQAANRLGRSVNIRAGDYLLVPHSAQSQSAYVMSEANRVSELQQQDRDGVRRVHVTQPGDSLWVLSREYGVSVRDLARWNGMAPGDTLSVGKTLVLWQKGDAPSHNVRRLRYTVRNGDSLWRIAQRFSVTPEQLRSWNGLRSDLLRPGQELRLFVDIRNQGAAQ